jgi:peptidoglycan/xylan/chitin deacetylase (PgdA/CDA1 family)
MTVLCYHAVDPAWSAPISVDPELFERHCAWLAKRRKVVPLDALVGAGGRDRAVAITFDDGFASVYDHAFPALRRYGLPATVFAVAGTLTARGRPVDWLDRPPTTGPPPTLTREQLLEMREAGIRVGSHGFAHADLTALGSDEIEHDLRQSRQVLEDLLGEPVPFVAYPRGRHDRRVRDAARRAGYTHAFTLPEGREPAGPYAWPRVGIYAGNGIGTLRLKVHRLYLPLRTGIRSASAEHQTTAASR